MKKVVFVLCALAMVCSCTFSVNVGNGKKVVCKGPVVEKTLDLTDFNAITVTGSSDLVIAQSQNFSVKVNANEEVFEHIDYTVENGTLNLKTRENVQIVAKTHKVYVTLPCLENLLVNGAADADIRDYTSDKGLVVLVNGAGDFEVSSVRVPSLTFTVNGAGDIDATGLDVETLHVSVNGAGDVDLSGKAGYASLSVSGAGDIDAQQLECPQIDMHKSGVASIKTSKKN